MKSNSDKIRILSKITSFTDVTKSFQEIEKVLNNIVDTIKTPAEKELKETEGSTGDIQITQNKDKSYTFEVRTKEGWKTPVIGNSAIKFTDKPSSLSKKQNKSIDEIEADDTSTGGKDAEKTIFDEKANKFILPRADYESDWLDADKDTTVSIVHNLGLTKEPNLVQLYASDNSSPTIGTNPIVTDFHLNENWGYRMHIVDANTINIYVGSEGGLYHEGTGTFGGADGDIDLETFQDGYIKVKIWK